MNASMKRASVAGVLLAGAGVGGFVWSAWLSRSDIDESVASVREEYSCASCGATFTLTISEAIAQRRTDSGIRCPKCGKGGAEKYAAYSADLHVPTDGPSPQMEPGPDEAREPDSSKGRLLGPEMAPKKTP